jgi:hypothetical protein
MRYRATVDPLVSVTTLSLEESCHTDSTPLVSEIFFRNADFDTGSAAFAMACLILTRRFVGEDVAFARQTLGIETVRALRLMCPWVISLTPVEGMNRSHTRPELDVVCSPTRIGPLNVAPAGDTPLQHIDWSGDFVDRNTRRSAGFRLGRYFTNAGLVTDDTTVSIAVGLMHAGGLCRDLHVPAPPDGRADDYRTIQAALAVIGVSLNFVSR